MWRGDERHRSGPSTPCSGSTTSSADGAGRVLFTENETNTERLFDIRVRPYTKDAFHRYVVDGDAPAVNPAPRDQGGPVYRRLVVAGGRPRCGCGSPLGTSATVRRFDDIVERRRAEADEFTPPALPGRRRRRVRRFGARRWRG